METGKQEFITKDAKWLSEFGIKIHTDEAMIDISQKDKEEDIWFKKSTTSKVYIGNLETHPDGQTCPDKKYAVKVSLFPYSKIDSILKEIELLNDLDHDNIIKPIMWYDESDKTPKNDTVIRTEPEKAFMVTDFEERGDLFMVLVEQARFEESEARHIFKQTLSAIQYLHDRDIVHRDIKLSNVLLSDDEQVKLIDFGHSCHLKSSSLYNHEGKTEISRMSDIKGTKGYFPPEILDAKTKIVDYLESNESSGSSRPMFLIDLKKCDIFSLGVILFEMVIGLPPFKNAHPRDSWYRTFYFKKKEARFWKVHSKAKELDEQGLISDDFKNLILGMLTPFPKNRFTIQQIEEHPWMKS